MKQNTTAGHDETASTWQVSSGNVPPTILADQSRRHFLKLNLLGLTLASTAGMVVAESAWAGRTGRTEPDNAPALLDPEDPQATALTYTAVSPKTKQQCSNCQLYTGIDGEEFGQCAIFSYRTAPNGKQLMVNAAGWCRAWGPRQDV
jgi:hypothetical protein